MLPPALKPYFWEVEFEALNPKQHAPYIIERILEYGDDRAVQWLFKNFKKGAIKSTLEKRRGFSERSANYWHIILGLPKNKITCLRKRFLKRRRETWPY